MTEIVVKQATEDDIGSVIDLVQRLLVELGEEGDEAGELDASGLGNAWRTGEERHFAFLAHETGRAAVGVATVVEVFALYASGRYGIINETYVTPEHRSRGVGALLVEAVKEFGRARGWRRVDVTAPESERWDRTRRFYEKQGFIFTGPKLKCLLT